MKQAYASHIPHWHVNARTGKPIRHDHEVMPSHAQGEGHLPSDRFPDRLRGAFRSKAGAEMLAAQLRRQAKTTE